MLLSSVRRPCIPLVARDGSLISNSIDESPTEGAIALAMRANSLAVAQATRLRPPTGQYNCHGLVFASRRTNVPAVGDDLDMRVLLKADGFYLIGGVPKPGDVAAYVDQHGEIEHTGFVVSVDAVGAAPVIFVWSAWGALGEFYHRAQCSPYSQKIEYWRLT